MGDTESIRSPFLFEGIMRFFDPDFFTDFTICFEDATKVAKTADQVLSSNAVCLWGKFDGRNYYDLSTYPKTGDHFKLIGVAPKSITKLGPRDVKDKERRS